MKTLVSFLVAVFIFQSVQAQDTGNSQISKAEKKEKNLRFIPFPIIYYSPETRLAFGALGQFIFRMSPEDTIARASTTQSNFIYTLNNQFLLANDYTLFTKEEKYIFNGSLDFLNFPEFFYGVGNDTDTDNEENFSYFSIDWDGYAVRKIKPKMFVGVSHKFMRMFDVRPDAGTALETSNLPGARGFTITGLGPIFLYDSRNSIINATKGSYFEASARIFTKALGGEYDYQLYRIDARKFFPLSQNERHVLAFQALGEFRNGDIPVHRLSRMGGDAIMRGHYNGRYRDNNLWAAQSEYRFPIYGFLGGVGFAGVGNVSDEFFSRRAFENIKYSLGGGLRFMIDKKDRVNVRVDYAFVEGGSEFYINFTEAF